MIDSDPAFSAIQKKIVDDTQKESLPKDDGYLDPSHYFESFLEKDQKFDQSNTDFQQLLDSDAKFLDDDSESVRKILEDIGAKNGFDPLTEYHRLTSEVLREGHSNHLLTEFNSLQELLRKAYPGIEFEKAIETRWREQVVLLDFVKKLFSGQKIEYNYRSRKMIFDHTGKPMEIDIFFPELGLGFEYQGEQHYRPVSIFGGEKGFLATTARDDLKRKKFAENGLVIIEIPYWWGRSMDFVTDMLMEEKMDFFSPISNDEKDQLEKFWKTNPMGCQYFKQERFQLLDSNGKLKAEWLSPGGWPLSSPGSPSEHDPKVIDRIVLKVNGHRTHRLRERNIL